MMSPSLRQPMTQDPVSPTFVTHTAMAGPAYPYGQDPLVPAWLDGRSQLVGAGALVLAVCATLLRGPIHLAKLDDWALHIAFPAMLAFVLAFAPRPSTRVGRIAKGLTCIGLMGAMFVGDFAPVMIVGFPILLAVSVGVDAWLSRRTAP
jgi:hypothetical protein